MKKIFAMAAIAMMTFAMPSCKSKVSDADVKTAVESALSSTPGLSVNVTDGAVTIDGSVADDAAKAAIEGALKGVKGVKSVANNVTIAPAPVINNDAALTELVVAALKDNPTVKAAIADSVITLTGEAKKADLQSIMQKVQALKPKKVDNKITVK
ncbi:MAG: BON domain-containing protein [Chitinophagaceae bacterium]|nr:MAG: BON domain-containing protein [Chitinophagaceae bacterium]